MDAPASATASNGSRIVGRPFSRGNREYHARIDRIAERERQLALEYDASTATAKSMIAVAARLLDEAERCRTSVMRVRAANAAGRLLRNVPRKPAPPAPSLSSYRKITP